jgi:hypothetical protein
MNGRLFLERVVTLTESAGTIKIKGVAIHPMATCHPNEFPDRRVYIEEELKKAIPSLIGKPLFLDHKLPLDGCKVTDAGWDESQNGVYFEAVVMPFIADKIKNGAIRKVSISVNPWRFGGGVKFVDGMAPFGFEFDELSLLENMTTGDPGSWVKLCEAMQSDEFIYVPIADVNTFKDDGFRET